MHQHDTSATGHAPGQTGPPHVLASRSSAAAAACWTVAYPASSLAQAPAPVPEPALVLAPVTGLVQAPVLASACELAPASVLARAAAALGGVQAAGAVLAAPAPVLALVLALVQAGAGARTLGRRCCRTLHAYPPRH